MWWCRLPKTFKQASHYTAPESGQWFWRLLVFAPCVILVVAPGFVFSSFTAVVCYRSATSECAGFIQSAYTDVYFGSFKDRRVVIAESVPLALPGLHDLRTSLDTISREASPMDLVEASRCFWGLALLFTIARPLLSLGAFLGERVGISRGTKNIAGILVAAQTEADLAAAQRAARRLLVALKANMLAALRANNDADAAGAGPNYPTEEARVVDPKSATFPVRFL